MNSNRAEIANSIKASLVHDIENGRIDAEVVKSGIDWMTIRINRGDSSAIPVIEAALFKFDYEVHTMKNVYQLAVEDTVIFRVNIEERSTSGKSMPIVSSVTPAVMGAFSEFAQACTASNDIGYFPIYRSGNEWESSAYEQIIGQPEKEMHVLTVDDKVLGLLIFKKKQPFTDFNNITLLVHPDYRRAGIGSHLFNKALALAKIEELPYSWVTFDTLNVGMYKIAREFKGMLVSTNLPEKSSYIFDTLEYQERLIGVRV